MRGSFKNIVKVLVFVGLIFGTLFYFTGNVLARPEDPTASNTPEPISKRAAIHVSFGNFVDWYTQAHGVSQQVVTITIEINCDNGGGSLDASVTLPGDQSNWTYNYCNYNSPGTYNVRVDVTGEAPGESSASPETRFTFTTVVLPAVDVNLFVNGKKSETIDEGGSVNMTWNTTGVSNCTASGAWSGNKADDSPAGGQNVTFNTAGSYTLTLTCKDSSGSSLSDSVTVNVNTGGGGGGTPSVTLFANPDSISVGDNTTLGWSSSNVNNCSVTRSDLTGAWSGKKATSGSETVGTFSTAGNYTFTLTCDSTVSTGSVSDSVVICVDCTGGGGGNDYKPITKNRKVELGGCTDLLHPTFRWTFSDGDPGDYQSRFRIRIWEKGSSVITMGASRDSPNNYFKWNFNSGNNALKYGTTYLWNVTVWDSAGNESNAGLGKEFTIVDHDGPTVAFSWAPNAPAAGETVNFTDATTYPAGGSASAYSWSFADGSPSSSVDQNPSTAFNSGGDKLVKLIVTDDQGTSCTANEIVTVSGEVIPPPQGKQGGFVPCGGEGQDPCTLCHIFVVLSNIFNLLVPEAITGFAALFIVWGGIVYATSGGSEDRIRSAKTIVINAIVGFVLAMAAVLLVHVIIASILKAKNLAEWGFDGVNIRINCTGGGLIGPTPPPGGGGGTGGGTPNLCADEAALAKAYGNALYPAGNSSELDGVINCIISNSNIVSATYEPKKLYTIDNSHPTCNYTRGNTVCDINCSHVVNSCHYGGATGINGAEGVDFNTKSGTYDSELQLFDAIKALQSKCNFKAARCEGDVNPNDCSDPRNNSWHTHVSTATCDKN